MLNKLDRKNSGLIFLQRNITLKSKIYLSIFLENKIETTIQCRDKFVATSWQQSKHMLYVKIYQGGV